MDVPVPRHCPTSLEDDLPSKGFNVMVKLRIDHIISYAEAATIDQYLTEYTSAGFLIYDQTVRHDPGLRNGFIQIGPEYLEICWVEDEKTFETASSEARSMREAHRPWGIGIVAKDVQALHDEWICRGYNLSDVLSKAPRDAAEGTPPYWSFQGIPPEMLPGAECFALTYHGDDPGRLNHIRVAPNSVYAIGGLSFVTSNPISRCEAWRNLLALDCPISQVSGVAAFSVGPHKVSWMTPEIYLDTYHDHWMPSSYANSDIAVVHLLAEDLRLAKEMLSHAGRQVRVVQDIQQRGNGLFVLPSVKDGFAFMISEQPIEVWLNERTQITGESLELSVGA